jgi:DNA topoisomerase I
MPTSDRILVILESPGKKEKMSKMLGDKYVIRASYGHVRDLNPKDLAIDIGNDYAPNYSINADKKKVVSDLREAMQSCKMVYLASDLDREGESIAWHLSKVLNLNESNYKRITFSEISKKAVLSAIENAGEINYNMNDAQQARRVIDRLLGYKISPILWKQIQSSFKKEQSLSAGRVQSVVAKIIIEREEEIKKFSETSYFKTIGDFKTLSGKYSLYGELSHQFKTEEDIIQFLEIAKNSKFTIKDNDIRKSIRNPSPPFITSTLQQESSNKFKMSPKMTMQCAQKLYEAGLITYMRTDSFALSEDAVKEIEDYIVEHYSSDYLNIREYSNKKNSQEAHEAIRPCDISIVDLSEYDKLSDSEKKLYKLIWRRTLASQMESCKVDCITNRIQMSQCEYLFICKGEIVTFPGFTKVYNEYKESDEDTTDISDKNKIKLKKGSELNKIEIESTFKLTKPKHTRYTEASLVKELEKLGIGRPSTYSNMVAIIQSRGYTEKKSVEGESKEIPILSVKTDNVINKVMKTIKLGAEKNKLFPTNTGVIVNTFLQEQFPLLLDYTFTSQLELSLDKIAEGKMKWQDVVHSIYTKFSDKIGDYASNSSSEYKDKYTRVLGEHPEYHSEIKVSIAKYGPVVSVDIGGNKRKFAPVKETDMEKLTLREAIQLLEYPKTIGEYKSIPISLQKGQYGLYLKYNNKNYSAKEPIDLDTAISIITQEPSNDNSNDKSIVKVINKDIIIKNGKYGPYISYKNKKNIKIKTSKKLEDLTKEDCLDMIKKS